MKFSLAALALPALALAGPIEEYNNLNERAACATANWLAGLTGIEASVVRLSSRFAAISKSDGSDINLTSFLADSGALISKINSEAASIGGCSPSVAAADNVQKEITASLYPKVSALSSIAVAKKVPISSRALQGVLRGQASSISSAVTSYGSSVKAKVPAVSTATVVSDVAVITAYITGVIANFQ